MQRRAKSLAGWALPAYALLACACGASRPAEESGSFAEAPLFTVSSDSGNLVIEVRTAPYQPPERGVARVQLVVRNANGAPQDDLRVSATPWMPAMGHGTSVMPTAGSQGQGAYVLDNVYLFMPGRWELRAAFSGTVSDRATAAFDVP